MVCVLSAVVLLVPLAGTGSAQGRAEGTIAGVVTDSTQGVLPGVTVTATNPATGFTRETTTDIDGSFVLPALPPAAYNVVANLAGFGTFNQQVTVTVASETRLAVTLSVATLQESVTVTGEAALVETTRTEQGSQFSQNEVTNLPMVSRSYLALAQLTPGVVGDSNSFSSSGNRNQQNNFNVDGMTNKNLNGGGDFGRITPEGIQEFQIVSQSYPAEYGGAAGGVTNAVSKSGTNTFSGYGFYYQRHDAFDAPPFRTTDVTTDGAEVTAVPVDAANYIRRQIAGFTVGGPIRRDKAFFFGVLDTSSTRTKRLRTLQPATIEAVRRLAFPDIPDNESNAAADFAPRDATTSFKVDWNLSQQNTLSFTGGTFRSFSPAGAVNGRSSVYSTSEGRNSTNRIGGSLNTLFSDRTLNQFRALRFRNDSRTRWPNRGGFENLNNWEAGLVIGGGSGGNFGLGELATLPHNHGWETHYEFQNTMTLFRNNHQFKFGGSYMWVDIMQYSFYYGMGEWRFADLNSFLAGRPSGLVQSFGSTGAYLKVNNYSWFVQDEWQPTSNLTINYGVRWDLNALPEDLSQVELPEPAFNQATGQFDTKVVSNSYAKGFKNDLNNFQPRLGVSWSVNDKTVVRGATGVFFGGAHYGEMAQGFANSVDGYARYDFPSVEATAIWAGLHDPASPYYNGGRMRLAQSYRSVLEAQGRPYSLFFHPSDLVMPRSYQASLAVERQVLPWLSVQASLLWNRGDGDYRSQNINPPAPVFYPAGSLLPSGVITPFDVNYRPETGVRPDPTRANIYTYTMVTRTRYKGASLSVNARRGGLQLRGSYTYNDTWDDGSDVSTRLLPSDSDCVPCEYSKSILSTTHFFRGAAVYQFPQSLPFYARDWLVSSINAFQSGAPILVNAAFDFNNDNIITDRPFGVPRGGLVGDARYTTDIRISRFFPIRNSVRAEVFFEMFNLFNRANFTGYTANLYRLSGGRYVPYPDFAAYAATSDLNVGFRQGREKITPDEIGLDAAGRRTGVGDPRNGQIGFRLHF
jgi:outer membrane receptor protein involved in Fe transport